MTTLNLRQNPYAQYKQQNIMTASPGELTLMLYDGCIKNLKLGKMYICENNIEKTNESLLRSQDIVFELVRTLDSQYEIAGQLNALYQFVLDKISASNISKSDEGLGDAIEILSGIREAWQEAVKLNRQQSYEEAGSI